MSDETSPAAVAGLAGLADADWLLALDDIGEERGYFEPLGPDHAAVFSDRGPVLLVTFETRARIRAHDSHLPLGFDLAEAGDWSQLTLVATGDSWFRDRRVYGYFDRLVDDGFFEDFDRVVFYGAGLGGYAAAAFSVAAPGATVLALSPQATLAPAIAGWDRRFPGARRFCFTDRYGYAPAMIDAAERMFLLYDPQQTADRIHAGQFVADHVTRLPLGHAGADIEAALARMGLLQGLVTAAVEGQLTAGLVHRAWRARRQDGPWLRAFAASLEAQGQIWRLAKAARSVAERTLSRRFRKVAARCIDVLAAEGRTLPRGRAEPSEAAE